MTDDDPLAVYLRELNAIPALAQDEENKLSRHLRANDEDAETAGLRLVEANLLTVVAIAERYRGSGIHILELIQRGNEGLLLALNSFAASSGESFSAHAQACIKRAIAAAAGDSRT